MAGNEVCDTQLSLGNGLGNPVSKPDHASSKRVLSLGLSLEVEYGHSSSENGGEIRKKLRLSKEQTSVLEGSFKERPNLNTAQKNELAAMFALNPRQVEVWFQNRRARTKFKQTESECEQWRQRCQTLTDENNMLKKEIQKWKAVEVREMGAISSPASNSMAISVCPTCHRVEEIPMEGGGATASVDVVQNLKIKQRSGIKI